MTNEELLKSLGFSCLFGNSWIVSHSEHNKIIIHENYFVAVNLNNNRQIRKRTKNIDEAIEFAVERTFNIEVSSNFIIRIKRFYDNKKINYKIFVMREKELKNTDKELNEFLYYYCKEGKYNYKNVLVDKIQDLE